MTHEAAGQIPTHLSYYAVAYVDLLGQADELLKVTKLPQTPEDARAVEETIKHSAGRVKAMRDAFDRFIANAAVLRAEAEELVMPQRREAFRQLRDIKITHRGFSDSFILTVSLANGDLRGAARGATAVWTLLFGLAGLWLVALSQRIPMRGGVDVGLGLNVFPNEVYGPGLVRAYHLESREAEYPRVVVGQELMHYLAVVAQVPRIDPLGQVAAKNSEDSQRLICRAPDDGKLMLDAFSPVVSENVPQLIELHRDNAIRFVEGERDRLRAADETKLADRYGRLMKYFDAHRS